MKKSLLYGLLLVSVLLAGQTAQTKKAPPTRPEDDDRWGPISDYQSATSIPTDAQGRYVRMKRASRYDVDTQNMPQDQIKGLELGESNPSRISLPVNGGRFEKAIPAADSSDIVVGTVKTAAAKFSSQKNVIYSEFQFSVEQTLKGDLVTEQQIDTERFGGRVRLPSGKIVFGGVSGHLMPQIGKRYLLFLKKDSDTQDFTILTGYQLENEKVSPLDGNEPGHSLSQFVTYRDANETSFLDKVREEILHPTPRPYVGGR